MAFHEHRTRCRGCDWQTGASDPSRLCAEGKRLWTAVELAASIDVGAGDRANRLVAPWTKDQVDGLNRYQTAGVFHEFTCGSDSGHHALIATPDGWVCPDCPHRQTWAPAAMVLSEEDVCAFRAALGPRATGDGR